MSVLKVWVNQNRTFAEKTSALVQMILVSKIGTVMVMVSLD